MEIYGLSQLGRSIEILSRLVTRRSIATRVGHRRDVTAKCYGGASSTGSGLREKRAKEGQGADEIGVSDQRSNGSVSISQAALIGELRIGEEERP
jgi:translation elongation factor EF-4